MYFRLILLFAFLVLSCESGALGPVSSRPNIVFIMSDDHAQRAISTYDSTLIVTPNIDRIAQEGVRFENAFVTNSICSPSRAVILTGKHSHLNSVRDNRDTFDSSQQTFPKILQDHGYETAIVGKWHLKSEPEGFDFWRTLLGQGEYYSPRIKGPEGVTELNGEYVTTSVTNMALDFLGQRNKAKPFALLVHHKAPHRNWMPEPKYLDGAYDREYPVPATFNDAYSGRPAAASQDMRVADLFLSWDMKLQLGKGEQETGSGGIRGLDKSQQNAVARWKAALSRLSKEQMVVWLPYLEKIAQGFEQARNSDDALLYWKYQRYLNDYIRTVRSIDDSVGRILDYLDENDLTDNTLVVYTSDQGFYLGEHGWYDKRFMYEESMRTPLVMRYTGRITGGISIDRLVQNLDLAPTILSFANISPPNDMQGLSLKPLMQGVESPKWRDALYYQYYDYPDGSHSVWRHYGVRTAKHKLIHFYDRDIWELYDLQADPNEITNVYEDTSYSNIRSHMHHTLAELRKTYGVPE